MWRCATLLISVTAAGLIAGADEAAFLAAAFAAAAADWRRRLVRTPAQRLYANLDPLAPDNATLAEALNRARAIVRLSQTDVRVRIAASQPARCPTVQIGLSGENAPQLLCGGRRIALGDPGVWLADHPLPLTIPRSRCLTLLFTPAGARRVRVAVDGAPRLRPADGIILAALAAAACATDANGALAALLSFAAADYLLEKQGQRATEDAGVKRG